MVRPDVERYQIIGSGGRMELCLSGDVVGGEELDCLIDREEIIPEEAANVGEQLIGVMRALHTRKRSFVLTDLYSQLLCLD